MGRKAEYGRGHENFLAYTRFIIEHPNYAHMPDVHLENGEIQWEAPSNRPAGKFQDTHNRRRDWWRRKAREVGISPDTPHWISKVAKEIHPTKKKPCKACGLSMDIRYAYPNHHLFKRISSLSYFDPSFELSKTEHISDLVPRMVATFGDRVFADLPKLLKAKGAPAPNLPPSLQDWLSWIDSLYIPSEPSILSPGVMSNPPDRLDGFHSFNLCCRQTSDTGRSKQNLQSYTTDRRVFEYWVDGDWVCADRLMGLVRSLPNIQSEPCRNDNHAGPCNADHIGPISLGFAHRPHFQLLCSKCNSAKNNRMYLSDVKTLRTVEKHGEAVVSWYCHPLWDMLKEKVTTEETSLRLCKILRDNRHTAMCYLHRIAADGHLLFLTRLLRLHYADCEPTFVNLRIANHMTAFDKVALAERNTIYRVEQKARRIRVAISALHDYVGKARRNALLISTNETEHLLQQVFETLRRVPPCVRTLNDELISILNDNPISEEKLRFFVTSSDFSAGNEAFADAESILNKVMRVVAEVLAERWADDRYIREEIDLSE